MIKNYMSNIVNTFDKIQKILAKHKWNLIHNVL